MTVSMIDGMLTAIVIGPRLVMPSEYIPWIWDAKNGEAPAPFDNEGEASEIFEIIVGMQNRIAGPLMASPPRYRPLFADDDHWSHLEWAQGFETGTTLDHGWDEVFDANTGEDPPDDFPWLDPFFALENPDAREIAGPEWPELLDSLEAMVVDLRDMFRASEIGRVEPQMPFVRSGPKIGRNDPCPCGSGRKYKKCCGSGAGATH